MQVGVTVPGPCTSWFGLWVGAFFYVLHCLAAGNLFWLIHLDSGYPAKVKAVENQGRSQSSKLASSVYSMGLLSTLLKINDSSIWHDLQRSGATLRWQRRRFEDMLPNYIRFPICTRQGEQLHCAHLIQSDTQPNQVHHQKYCLG